MASGESPLLLLKPMRFNKLAGFKAVKAMSRLESTITCGALDIRFNAGVAGDTMVFAILSSGRVKKGFKYPSFINKKLYRAPMICLNEAGFCIAQLTIFTGFNIFRGMNEPADIRL